MCGSTARASARGHLVGARRQRDEHRFLLAEEDALPAALALLEGAGVYRRHLVDEGAVELRERHEAPVAQRRHRLALDDADAHLDAALVAGPAHPGRRYGTAVALAHASVPLVDDERVLRVLGRGRLAATVFRVKSQ